MGTDLVIEALNKNKSQLIFVSTDFSPSSLRKIENANKNNRVSIIKLPYSMDELQLILNKVCGVVSINDLGFSNKMKNLLNFKEDF